MCFPGRVAVTGSKSSRFVSRGGDKLAAALDHFGLDVTDRICADLGSHVGGFVDCLLQRGAARVYSVDTAYGTLAWTLRRDPRVEVLERTNAMHVSLPEAVDLVTIDAGWTPQEKILPSAAGLLTVEEPAVLSAGSRPRPLVVTLIKPHYEAEQGELDHGVLPDSLVETVVCGVLSQAGRSGWKLLDRVESPIRGHGGNREHFALFSPSRTLS